MSEPGFARVSLLDAHAPESVFTPLRARPGDAPASVTPKAAPEPDLYAEGFAAGERAAREALQTRHAAMQQLLATADALQPEPSEELAAMIATTVERLVTELVGRMPVERDWLAGRIELAMACLGEADAARTLWLHPEDMALLADADLPLKLSPDPCLERGALRIDCSHGGIEDSRSLHLETLRTSLGIEAGS